MRLFTIFCFYLMMPGNLWCFAMNSSQQYLFDWNYQRDEFSLAFIIQQYNSFFQGFIFPQEYLHFRTKGVKFQNILIEMLRKSFSRFCFAIIKANKAYKEADLTASSINDCRQLFGLPKCEKLDLEEKAKKYIKERAQNKIQKPSAQVVYSKWAVLRPLQQQINILSFSKAMEPTQSSYLYRVYSFWGNFLLEEDRGMKNDSGSAKLQFKQMVLEYSKSINSCCYLLNLDEEMIVLYIKIYIIVNKLRGEDRNYSHLRYILDNLLKLKNLREESLDSLLIFTSRVLMQSVYHQREIQILNFIYRNLPNFAKQKRYHHKILLNFLFNVSRQSYVPAEIKNTVVHVYKNYTVNVHAKVRAFVTLLQLFVLDKETIEQEEHMKNIAIFIKQFPLESFKNISKVFYLADIWLEDFWIPYFQFLLVEDNFKYIQNYHHHIIDDLILEGKKGGKKLQAAAQKFRLFLKDKKNIEIFKLDARKDYEKTFGRVKEHKNSCQLHVANSMRLICSAQILTQVAIKYFMVDILVDKDTVVEINNTNHYKLIDGKSLLNLKSQFRERILGESGYRCFTIKVDDLSSSNYNMLQEIYKIVESASKTMTITRPALPA